MSFENIIEQKQVAKKLTDATLKFIEENIKNKSAFSLAIFRQEIHDRIDYLILKTMSKHDD